jgi:FkbM family methyltransferase
MALPTIVLQLATDARSVARKWGILRPLALARSWLQRLLGRESYEYAFDNALKRAVKDGDVVWDVGANLGLYTVPFSDRAGPLGEVCAFEPTPACFGELKRATEGRSNVKLFNLALGDEAGSLPMSLASDELGATHSLAMGGGAQDGQTIQVDVVRGDSLLARQNLRCPNVIKIDVEGFEEEVVRGLSGVLTKPECRAVLIEMHFGILEARGERHAPLRIRTILQESGFHVSWTDTSHLSATRS